jgi:hypothetical protein
MNTLLTSHDTFKDVVARLIDLMNSLIWPLIGIAVIFFFYGLIRYIYDAGNAKGHARGRDIIVWSLIGLFVIFSLWGFIRLLQDTFSLRSSQEQIQPGMNNYGGVPFRL